MDLFSYHNRHPIRNTKMALKSRIWLMLPVAVSVFASCSDNDALPSITLRSPGVMEEDARCSMPHVRFSSAGAWRIESDADWVTPTLEKGSGDADLPLYVEQNDGETMRRATLRIIGESGPAITVSIFQNPADDNGVEWIADLPSNFGLGWGYDCSVDYADGAGIRGQIFNAEKLRQIYKNSNAATAENFTSTNIVAISSQTSESLKQRISTTLTGEVDLKIAGAKVEAEFTKQIQENKDRLYVWYRDCRVVKRGLFTIDILDKNRAPQCFTENFRNAVDSLCQGKMSNDMFISRYGTHMVTHSYLGGKFDYWFTVSQDVKETTETIALTVTVKFLGLKKSATSVSEDTWKDIKKDFIGSFKVSGGGKPGRTLNDSLNNTVNKGVPLDGEELITKWQQVFTSPLDVTPDQLAMVDFKITPIWKIVSMVNRETSSKLKSYIRDHYLK